MERTDCEVLVVGAGPAGSWTARRLSEAGRDVVLADENRAARDDVVCTGIVGEEAYGRFDLPAEAAVDTIEAAVFHSPGGERLTYDPAPPLARVVDRTRFDGALARRAGDAGARLRRGWAARAVGKGDGAVTVGFETPDGSRAVRARALVVATGHQRWLHEPAGLGTPDAYVHGVHADLPFRSAGSAELYFGSDLAPDFFAWAVPFGDGEARLGVLSRQGSRRHFRRFLEHPRVRGRLRLEAAGAADDPVRARLRSRGIVQGPVTPSVSDRVLAVGEAAGQVKTTTAGGIYYGLQGAELAAGVLDDALGDGGPTEAALAPYEDAWRGRLGREIRAGLRLQRAVRGMRDAEIDGLFHLLQGPLGSAVRAAVRFDWHRPALELLFAHRWIGRLLGGGSTPMSRAG